MNRLIWCRWALKVFKILKSNVNQTGSPWEQPALGWKTETSKNERFFCCSNHIIIIITVLGSVRLPLCWITKAFAFDNCAYFFFFPLQQCNDVGLMAYLGTITKTCNSMNQFINKFNVLYDRQGIGRRMRGLFFWAGGEPKQSHERALQSPFFFFFFLFTFYFWLVCISVS